ncbi:septal ring lytic transglycosylase RlpA family protein [Roseibium salinum]|uniref:Endolytic peptidoglycan transglycosylase RlpA n=1 Tax=Roseibium salinum TaxID=1604349 RepID=A0ABT3R5S1_9HYPH|nr:septal ring lytic transglycosylase RlpA family protein [Roseibium sp. DSM 29163]MCX2724499.1 septal ring lytic transglycosylase RlpA family protein [Roseibium sp. DSM 29163]MDN3721506.1 septal ring lytic transglycosylase RlpA family protein [Roseibium salinum]
MRQSNLARRLRRAAICAFALSCLSAQAQASPVTAFKQCGKASWYKLGGTTASGERANPNGLTAAHRTLPFGTLVTVTNLSNGKSVTVRINDRGPFTGGRVIDLTWAAAKSLGFVSKGITRVQVSGLAVEASSSSGKSCG